MVRNFVDDGLCCLDEVGINFGQYQPACQVFGPAGWLAFPKEYFSLRFIIRFIGLITLALGFIGIVIDGTRSMANASMLFTSVAEVSDVLFPSAIHSLQSLIGDNGALWLWDDFGTYLLRLPASIVAFIVGAILLKLGQKREPVRALLEIGNPD